MACAATSTAVLTPGVKSPHQEGGGRGATRKVARTGPQPHSAEWRTRVEQFMRETAEGGGRFS